MSKLFHCTAPVALTLAASLFCSAAHAAQQDPAGSQLQVALTHRVPADLAVQQPHRLTRKQVYDQLVREENNGTLARIDALYEGS
jgi:hypothetical protein